jgi:hypothetical protein
MVKWYCVRLRDKLAEYFIDRCIQSKNLRCSRLDSFFYKEEENILVKKRTSLLRVLRMVTALAFLRIESGIDTWSQSYDF